MCGRDCELVLRHSHTVRIPFVANWNLLFFCANTKRTGCAWCPFHAPGVLCSPQVCVKLIYHAPHKRRARVYKVLGSATLHGSSTSRCRTTLDIGFLSVVSTFVCKGYQGGVVKSTFVSSLLWVFSGMVILEYFDESGVLSPPPTSRNSKMESAG